MLYYDRIDVPEGIYVNKTSASKECDICHYWHFLDKGFKFQPYVYNECHDVLVMSKNLNNIAILNIYSAIIVILLMALAKLRLQIYCKMLN